MRIGAAAVVACLLSACVPHPVGPARTFAKYEGKAASTAKAALSAVETARLVAEGATRHRLFGPYVGIVLGESEDDISGVIGTFSSIQPPDDKADALRTELGDLLDAAESHVSDLRIAARRGRIAELASMADVLRSDAEKLDRFQQEH
jgi:hypothetical protein